MIVNANEYARPGYYTCLQCGKSIKLDGAGRMKACDKCKGKMFMFMDDGKPHDLSYDKFKDDK